MSDHKPGRKIMDGRVGDPFIVPKGYEGKFENAVKVPLNTPRGKAYPIPQGSGTPDLTVVNRPDFRSEPKSGPVHQK
ncbi:hypothetical protein B9Z55_007786 [Caenorhabditis nigoni]|uniref:Uncharacterized protein n=1 Tax=Caenorhabditis nigoni TaxID=1611254 RepID=A0A2G5VB76_9PELO|nr:hypothetical protein B9Z55_007786 [Caenorhabditis nigoni]